jgi:hypothetical protein
VGEHRERHRKAWVDNRHGMGLLDPNPELFLDTYWRK